MKKTVAISFVLILTLSVFSCGKGGNADTTSAEALASETEQSGEDEMEKMLNPDGGISYELTEETYTFIGRWFEKDIDGVSHRVTVNDGSEICFAVKGTDKINVIFTEISKGKTPYFAFSIDGGMPKRQKITDSEVAIPDMGAHSVRIITDGITESEAKYSGGIGFAFKEINANGGEIIGIKPKNKIVMFYGDSITEGVRALGMDADSDGNSATHSYPWYTAQRLKAVAINCGFAASGIVGAGSFAPFLDAIDKLTADIKCEIPAPDVIVINYGHNDVYFKNTDVTPRLKSCLDRIAAKYPSVPVFYVLPYSQTHADTIRKCCEGRDNVYVIETEGWNLSTTDGIHLNSAGADQAGKKISAAIKEILGEEFFNVK